MTRVHSTVKNTQSVTLLMYSTYVHVASQQLLIPTHRMHRLICIQHAIVARRPRSVFPSPDSSTLLC